MEKKLAKRMIAALCVCAILLGAAAFASAETSPRWDLEVMGFDLLKAAAQAGDERLNRPLLIAVLDTGCDGDHAAFTGRISPDSRSFMDDCEDPTDYSDQGGHGTAIASIIADATPETVQLLILKVHDGNCYASGGQFSAAIMYALEKGAAVINMSIAVTSNRPIMEDPPVFAEAIRQSYEQGIPVISGVGNGRNDTVYNYPAADSYAIAASAVSQYGSLNGSSNYGEGVSFCAPGTDVLVATANTQNDYHLTSGSSVSSAQIAAAAAYVKLLHPAASVEEVRAALRSCALDPGRIGKDKYFGDGMPQLSLYVLDKEPTSVLPVITVFDSTESFEKETADNLFIGLDSRKWCVKMDNDGAFVEWKQPTPIRPASIIFVTANDNETYPGRNPANAKLYGRYSLEDDWTLIWTQPRSSQIPDVNFTAYLYPFTAPKETYQYFRLEIPGTTGSNIMQLARVELLE